MAVSFCKLSINPLKNQKETENVSALKTAPLAKLLCLLQIKIHLSIKSLWKPEERLLHVLQKDDCGLTRVVWALLDSTWWIRVSMETGSNIMNVTCITTRTENSVNFPDFWDKRQQFPGNIWAWRNGIQTSWDIQKGTSQIPAAACCQSSVCSQGRDWEDYTCKPGAH